MINFRPWPFREPRDRGVFTTIHVLAGVRPVLAIVHDSGTGGWHFRDMRRELWSMVGVTLEEVAEILKPDVLEVAIGLPLYSKATRASVNDPWIREYWDGRVPRKAKAPGRSLERRAKNDP